MPPPRFASPFSQLHLSTDERDMLIRTADDLVNQAQQKYEWFLWQDRERLDSDRWQFVRTRDDLTAYVDRRLPEETGNRNMQLLLTTGSMEGTLHDAMYGSLNQTNDAMKLNTAYMQDTLLDSAILESIVEPTVNEPFQSLSLRWFVKEMPLHVRAMNKKHSDNVSIEAAGVRQLYNGEKIGYHIVHSVAIPEAPPLPQYERHQGSICMIWRQMTPTRVQAYMTCYIEIAESFTVPMQLKSIAEGFVSQSRTAHFAKMKKLAWYIEQKNTTKQLEDKAGGIVESKPGCSVCGTVCPLVFKCTSACVACSKPTCGRCRVKHEMFMLGSQRQLIKTKVRVCQPCMKAVEELDSGVVAQNEAIDREQQSDGSVLQAVLGREARVSTASSVSSNTSTENSMI